MNLIDTSIEERGFAPRSIALSIRTVGACPGMRQYHRDRLLVGIGLIRIEPDGASYRFDPDARCMAEDISEDDLLDWLQAHLSADKRAVVSWDNWGSVPDRLVGLADPVRHAALITAARSVRTRWRDQLRGHTWHLRQTTAQAMPCLCSGAASMPDCRATPLISLLPPPDLLSSQLIDEAVAGWRCWAQDFCDLTVNRSEAQQALRALEQWQRTEPCR